MCPVGLVLQRPWARRHQVTQRPWHLLARSTVIGKFGWRQPVGPRTRAGIVVVICLRSKARTAKRFSIGSMKRPLMVAAMYNSSPLNCVAVNLPPAVQIARRLRPVSSRLCDEPYYCRQMPVGGIVKAGPWKGVVPFRQHVHQPPSCQMICHEAFGLSRNADAAYGLFKHQVGVAMVLPPTRSH